MMKIRTVFLKFLSRRSYKEIVIIFFLAAAVVPMLFLQIVSYAYLKNAFQKNTDQLSQANVEMTRSNVESMLSAYEDILYQIYTNDDIIENVKNIDNDEELAMNMNRLRNHLRAMCYAKEEIEAVSIITPEGHMIHYDKLTASFVNSSWANNVEKTRDEIYTMGMQDYETHILPTHYARKQLDKPQYLFHLVHRVINYKDTEQACGVAVLSLNENLLEEICQEEQIEHSYSYIVDDIGRIISHENKEKIGIMSVVPTQNTFTGKTVRNEACYVSEPVEGWRVVTVYEQDSLWHSISAKLRNFFIIGVVITVLAVGIILFITQILTHSMSEVIDAMQQAQGGNLNVSVSRKRVVSREMMSIIDTFNKMMRKISELLEEIKESTRQRKDAEIIAMEAQINPHFLYNILDSINWMAIENDEFEISHMVTALAKILRYSINRSNAIVPLREELEWVRQYVYLQSIRFKDDFEYVPEVEQEELLNFQIHKLILQPFIENSIVHGFKDSHRKNILRIHISELYGRVRIEIRDNGKGIEQKILTQILEEKEDVGDHIGMKNAIGRIYIYYGDAAEVSVESEPGKGTVVVICIPKEGI